MNSCECGIYVQLGFYVAGFLFSLWILAVLTYIWNFLVSFVTEEDYRLPKFMCKLAKKIDFPHSDREDHIVFMGGLLIFLSLTIFIWPLILICVVVYSILRVFRYMYRIKKAIYKVLNSKTCLKDYKEDSVKDKDNFKTF